MLISVMCFAGVTYTYVLGCPEKGDADRAEEAFKKADIAYIRKYERSFDGKLKHRFWVNEEQSFAAILIIDELFD